MNHFKRYARHASVVLFISLFVPGGIALGSFIFLREVSEAGLGISIALSVIAMTSATLFMQALLRPVLLEPVEKLWQAIWHVSPGKSVAPAPKLEGMKLGRELVSTLVMQVYDLASRGGSPAGAATQDGTPTSQPHNLLEQLPLAVIILDKERNVTGANSAVADLLALPKEKIDGKNIYDVLRLSFMTDDTFDTWLQESAAHRATDTHTWEHVRVNLDDTKTVKQVDMAAAYSKNGTDGNEVVIVLFDHSKTYGAQDQATSYVALAVHELRTPLTVLRGYIEVFEDELGGQLNPELREFMRKMSAASQSLGAFVSNILNVARVDENQLVLTLREDEWSTVLSRIIKDLELRASVRGKVIELAIEPNLPKVGIDKISMYEVVSNLVDNAIKYSGQSPKVIVKASLGKDGTIETVVQDFGMGMPESTLKELFTKYYRSHRSRNAVGGSGLGLYLVKAIVTAHGGSVWVSSKEGEGSTFGFSLQPYTNVASEAEKSKDGIERQASGWIKNHSLYRQ